MTDSERAVLEAQIRDAWTSGDHERAATAVIRGFGPELLRYLLSLARDEAVAQDAFSLCCESVWQALPKFRGDASFRVWAYAIARHAWFRVLRDPHRRAERRIPLSAVPSIQFAAAEVTARTAEYLRSETKDKVARLRAALAPDDQALLVLRVNRKLEWNEISRALADPGEELAAGELARRAAALRKRFQRIKDELRDAVKR